MFSSERGVISRACLALQQPPNLRIDCCCCSGAAGRASKGMPHKTGPPNDRHRSRILAAFRQGTPHNHSLIYRRNHYPMLRSFRRCTITISGPLLARQAARRAPREALT